MFLKQEDSVWDNVLHLYENIFCKTLTAIFNFHSFFGGRVLFGKVTQDHIFNPVWLTNLDHQHWQIEKNDQESNTYWCWGKDPNILRWRNLAVTSKFFLDETNSIICSAGAARSIFSTS